MSLHPLLSPSYALPSPPRLQLLAPARSGTSTLLKVLAGRVPQRLFDGDVWLAGRRLTDVNAHRLVAYVGAEDTHLPLLTVR